MQRIRNIAVESSRNADTTQRSCSAATFWMMDDLNWRLLASHMQQAAKSLRPLPSPCGGPFEFYTAGLPTPAAGACAVPPAFAAALSPRPTGPRRGRSPSPPQPRRYLARPGKRADQGFKRTKFVLPTQQGCDVSRFVAQPVRAVDPGPAEQVVQPLFDVAPREGARQQSAAGVRCRARNPAQPPHHGTDSPLGGGPCPHTDLIQRRDAHYSAARSGRSRVANRSLSSKPTDARNLPWRRLSFSSRSAASPLSPPRLTIPTVPSATGWPRCR